MQEVKIILNVGVLALSYAENTIKAFCFKNDIECKIEGGAGILSKPLFITMEVENEDVDKVEEAFKQWINKYNK